MSLLIVAGSACGPTLDRWFCDGTSGCGSSDVEWARLLTLTNLGLPPTDLTNGVVGSAAAVKLGQAFFFDTRFSGPATQVDALARPSVAGRAPLGQETGLSCASCHDLTRMGVDVISTPGNVSSGAGWTDVNALAVVNSAYQRLFFWNGRADSLWSLAAAVAESPTTMGGNRLHVAWVIVDAYRQEYEAVFASQPARGTLGFPLFVPSGITSAQVAVTLESSGPRAGQCLLSLAGTCPSWCRTTFSDPPSNATGCWPQFPLQGRPGAIPGCQSGDGSEPFGDAWDCMSAGDREAVTRVLVNWAKAIAAYERQLVSVDSPFDQFMREGPGSGAISPAAQRGARLFVGKAGCIDCHGTPLLSDQGFHNIGVPQTGPNVPTEAECPPGSAACDCSSGARCLPWGALDGLARLRTSKTLRTSVWSDAPDDTSRKADLARDGDPSLKGAWRTPSLRGVALTAPYMHDGVYATLREVVAHYARGGEPDAIGTRAAAIKPLLLTDGEQAELVAFLESLTGPPLPAALVTAPWLPPTPPSQDAGIDGRDAAVSQDLRADGQARADLINDAAQVGDALPTSCGGDCVAKLFARCPIQLPCRKSTIPGPVKTVCFANGARAVSMPTSIPTMASTSMRVFQDMGSPVCIDATLTPRALGLMDLLILSKTATVSGQVQGPPDDPFRYLDLRCQTIPATPPSPIDRIDLHAPACTGDPLAIWLLADQVCVPDADCQ